MQFEPSTTAETFGKLLGFCVMFAVFTTIMFLLVTRVWGKEWLFFQALAMTGAIVLTGELIRRQL